MLEKAKQYYALALATTARKLDGDTFFEYTLVHRANENFGRNGGHALTNIDALEAAVNYLAEIEFFKKN